MKKDAVRDVRVTFVMGERCEVELRVSCRSVTLHVVFSAVS